MLQENEIYYLQSILRQLREIKSACTDFSLGVEILADNIDWLDCLHKITDASTNSK